jgi:hypothetical protein
VSGKNLIIATKQGIITVVPLIGEVGLFPAKHYWQNPDFSSPKCQAKFRRLVISGLFVYFLGRKKVKAQPA